MSGADYAAVLEIDLDAVREPLLACPNDPDDVRPLSEVAGDRIDEVFIGSCMTNIGHFRAAARIFAQAPYPATKIWLTPPTRMDAEALKAEGLYSVFSSVGGRVEIPGCSLCMGNQARVRPGATVLSTSTRNFDNRMGDGSRVYLGSAELAAVTAIRGSLPGSEAGGCQLPCLAAAGLPGRAPALLGAAARGTLGRLDGACHGCRL